MSSAPSAGQVSLRVNGREVVIDRSDKTMLLDVLRDDLSLRGTRTGCLEGHCGSCTVLVAGRPIQSCNTPLWSVAGQDITTIEGSSKRVREVVAKFLQEQAAQCGYCINGMVMTMASVIERKPVPDRDSIIRELDERHLCRCGAHARILRVLDQLMAERGAA